MGENTKTVFVGVDGVKSLFGFLEDIGVAFAGFEMGAKLGGFGQNGDNSFKFRVRDADIVFGAARLRNLGTTYAFVINRADGLAVDTDNVLRFRGCFFSFQGNLDLYSILLEFGNHPAYDNDCPVLARLVKAQG